MKTYYSLFIVIAYLGIFMPAKIFASAAVKIPTKTNRNEVTREFDEIQNRSSFEANNNALREDASRNVGGGAMAEVFSPNEALVGDLKGIDDMSLESRGLEAKGSETNDYFRENNFETDYTRPGAMAHKRDVDEIVALTESKLAKLTEVLRRNGIDCEPKDEKTKEIEDPYYIEIETSQHKEVEYDPHFCEFPRNIYSCNDVMTIHCEKPNKKWDEWKTTTVKIQGRELLAACPSALYSDHVADRIFEMKLFSSNSRRWGPRGMFGPPHNSVPHLKPFLAKKHNITRGRIFDISDNMTVWQEGGVFPLGGKGHAWNTYGITYSYREGDDICDKWSEPRWDERCSQKN